MFSTLINDTTKMPSRMRKSLLISIMVLLMQPIMAQENFYSISCNNLVMTVDAEHGARIMSFSIDGREVLSQSRFPHSFGSTFWTSPQAEWDWPPVPEMDSMPYSVEHRGEILVMTSALSQKMPFRVIKEFRADREKGCIAVSYTLVNESGAARKVAPWEITRVPNAGSVYFEADASQITPKNLISFVQKGNLAWYDADEAKKDRKINADGSGWLCYENDGLRFTKRFPDLDKSQPAPAEAEIQLYVNPGRTYMELENQGAYVTLENGASLTYTVCWYLEKI